MISIFFVCFYACKVDKQPKIGLAFPASESEREDLTVWKTPPKRPSQGPMSPCRFEKDFSVSFLFQNHQCSLVLEALEYKTPWSMARSLGILNPSDLPPPLRSLPTIWAPDSASLQISMMITVLIISLCFLAVCTTPDMRPRRFCSSFFSIYLFKGTVSL